MLNFINSIPESIGWALVGCVGFALVIMISLIIKTIAEGIAINKEEDD